MNTWLFAAIVFFVLFLILIDKKQLKNNILFGVLFAIITLISNIIFSSLGIIKFVDVGLPVPDFASV